MRRSILVFLVLTAFVLSACIPIGQPAGSPVASVAAERPEPTAEPTPEPTPEPTADPVTGGCLPVEEPRELEPTHIPTGESFDDYSSDPPSSGPHWTETEEEGSIYAFSEVEVERLVHNMEHGAVILWTNGLSDEEISAADEAINTIYQQGYGALIAVHDYPMDPRLATTAWGFYQACEDVDEEAIQAFVDAYYASGPPNNEGAIACAAYEQARDLPGCEKWADLIPPN